MVEYRKEEQIAWLKLDRPEKMNALNRALALSLQEHLDRCKKDETIRVVIITGNGKAFCAGQDLTEGADIHSLKKILPEQLNPLVQQIRTMPKPVIAAVNGVAAGAGASLALSCDIVLAAASARFVQAFSKLGLIPDSGSTWLLPRMVGLQRATALMMLAEPVDAEEAVRIGMAYRMVPDEQLQEVAKEMAMRLAGLPEKGLALTKEALGQSYRNTFDVQLTLEESLQNQCLKQEGLMERIGQIISKKK